MTNANGRVAGITAVLIGSAVLVAQDIRRDGRWEIKIEMSMPNMPAGVQMQPMTVTHCITADDAVDPEKAMAPPLGRPETVNDCKVADFRQAGNTVTYALSCTTPQAVKGTGEFVYGTDKYDGTLNLEMARGGKTIQIAQKYSAKRLGDCVK